jgi:alkylation response protein AidB-like acyl-CoA dehydrogenase
LNAWAIETNRDENLPALRRFDGNGNRTEEVVFHPAYHEMGRTIYGSGIMKMYDNPGDDVVQMAMFYMFMQNGEAGHNCPLACTAGAIKLLTRVGSDDLQAKYLPRLLDPDYDTHLHASQFLTELQGGSDVGANATVAVSRDDGTYRLYGEKWFCSVADAGIFVLTARPEGAPEGTKGLMTFIAPRYLDDGVLNHFELKRLKYKIGTRSMASAEIDLNGLVAYAVGKAGEGFKHVVDIVLNTSRLYNGFAAAAIVRRSHVEAKAFAAAREAFGKPIVQFPLIRRSLAFLRLESALQLASSLHVADLAGKIAAEAADENEGKAFRFLVNANKYVTSIGCTRAVREAIEVLGGNGTIEEFSVLPRLYRDAIVLESWEGTHNVLCQQLLRDMARYRIQQPVFSYARERIERLAQGDFEATAASIGTALAEVEKQCETLLAMEANDAQLHIRAWIDAAMVALQALDLLHEAAAESARGEDTGKKALLDYCIATRIEKRDVLFDENIAEMESRLA